MVGCLPRDGIRGIFCILIILVENENKKTLIKRDQDTFVTVFIQYPCFFFVLIGNVHQKKTSCLERVEDHLTTV